MQTLKCLMKQYREELENSKRYAKAYASHKHEDHELASIYLDLSKQEHSHAEIIERQIERHLEKCREHSDCMAMHAIWEWERERGEEIKAATQRFLETH